MKQFQSIFPSIEVPRSSPQHGSFFDSLDVVIDLLRTWPKNCQFQEKATCRRRLVAWGRLWTSRNSSIKNLWWKWTNHLRWLFSMRSAIMVTTLQLIFRKRQLVSVRIKTKRYRLFRIFGIGQMKKRNRVWLRTTTVSLTDSYIYYGIRP